MKKVVTILLLIISASSYAQQSHMVMGEGSFGLNMPFDFIIKPDNNVLYMVNVADMATEIKGTDIHEVSPQGEILQRIYLADTSISGETGVKLFLLEDTVYVLSNGRRTDEKEHPMLIMRKMDMQLNIIETYHIGLDLGYCDFLTPDGEFVYHNGNFEGFGSNVKTNGIVRPFFIRLSKYGEVVKLMEDTAAIYNHRPLDFLYRPDNQGYYVFEHVFGAPMPPGTYIYHYDSELNTEAICELPFGIPNYVSAIPNDDNSFFIADSWFADYPYQGLRMGMFEMKPTGEVIQEFLYSDLFPSHVAYFNSIDLCPDGNFIMCGMNNLYNQLWYQDEPNQIMLFKLDENLELVWQRYIGSEMGKFDAFVVRCAPNGDIIIAGNYWKIPMIPPDYNKPLFIRTNPDGIITSTSDKDIEIRSSEAMVYPNPAHHQLTINFSPAYPHADFKLRSIDGKIVLQSHLTEHDKTLDISALSPGTYIYTLNNSQGLNESGKIIVE